MKEIQIESIVRIVRLLQKANNEPAVLVSETAKEMGVKKTDLTEFILSHPGLFRTTSDKKGLRISNAFTREDNNPYSPLWLERQQREWAKTLYVAQWDCYGQKEHHYLPQDDEHHSYDDKRYSDMINKWRNTREKIAEVEKSGHFFNGTGSTGMFSGTALPYCLNTEHMKALIDEGWTLEGELPEIIVEYQKLAKNPHIALDWRDTSFEKLIEKYKK